MEKRQNYSRKREAILQAVRSTTLHPSAEWVYRELKPVFPDLSLGTVYRNLAQFKVDGVIVSVGTVNGRNGSMAPPSRTPISCAINAAVCSTWRAIPSPTRARRSQSATG